MTQVKEMSNAELNRELTKLQGYSVQPERINPKWYRMVNPQGQEFGVALPSKGLVWNEYAFPYCTDAAASLEVQTAACKFNADRYVREVAVTQGWTAGNIISRREAAKIATATPRERAEAAYLTLGGE